MSNTRNQSNHVTILAALVVAGLALVIACAGPATAEALPATGVPPTEKSAPPVDPTTTEPESGETSDITGIVWQWASLVETEPSAQSVVPDPAKYTFLLTDDGTADITADCNKVSGSYTLDGNMLTISTLGPCGRPRNTGQRFTHRNARPVALPVAQRLQRWVIHHTPQLLPSACSVGWNNDSGRPGARHLADVTLVSLKCLAPAKPFAH